MSFEEYKNNIIKDFIKNLNDCNILNQNKALTEDQIIQINEELNKHEVCFNNHKENFDLDNCELIGSYLYSNIAVSIECNHCQEVIIDDEVLML